MRYCGKWNVEMVIQYGGDVLGNESIKEYYEKNKEWLQKVAQSSDIVVVHTIVSVLMCLELCETVQ